MAALIASDTLWLAATTVQIFSTTIPGESQCSEPHLFAIAVVFSFGCQVKQRTLRNLFECRNILRIHATAS